MDIQELIKKTVKATNAATVKELKKQNMLKDNKRTPFQKTESLLYNYAKFQEALKSKHAEINFIKEEGISRKSTSFIQASSGSRGYIDISNDYDRAESILGRIQASIHDIERHIRKIDWALLAIKDDPYFDIIRMNYFESESREYIAEYFDVDASTISRNKNRLINQLQIRLFSDEVLMSLLE